MMIIILLNTAKVFHTIYCLLLTNEFLIDNHMMQLSLVFDQVDLPSEPDVICMN